MARKSILLLLIFMCLGLLLTGCSSSEELLTDSVDSQESDSTPEEAIEEELDEELLDEEDDVDIGELI